VFASGSPFDMVEVNGQQFYPGQGNNSYIFPGVAFGAVLAGLNHIPDAMFLKASQVTTADCFTHRCIFLDTVTVLAMDVNK